MKTIIIDDSEMARVALKSDIQIYCPQLTIIGEAESVFSGLELILKLKPELVFLDIRMADGTGFDILEQLKIRDRLNFKTIFTTAYNEYAIKAFKFSAIDYLLKPIDADDLKEAVNKCVDKTNNSQSINMLMDSFKDIQTTQKRIALSSADKIQIVAIQEIISCESQRNYTLFYLTENRQILVTKPLKDYEDLLTEYSFIRVHHSHLINIKHLKEFVKIDGGYAIMSDKSQIPVSVRKRDDLLKALGVGV